MAEVVLDGHSYSLTEIPEAKTPLVIKEQQNLLGSIDLEILVDDLGRVGNCVRIAYHGVTGFVDLQIEIQRIGYDVTRLCDKSALTVGKFKNASSTILGSLKATYEFLMENFEDMALETLADVTETAKGMATAAEELRVEFDNQAKKVIEALEKTQKTQDTEEKRKEKIEDERKQMEIEKEKQEKLEKDAAEARLRAETMAREADSRENEALQALLDINKEEQNRSENTGFWKKLINLFTGEDTRAAAALETSMRSQEDKAKAAREEKMRHLTLMQEKEEMRSKALAELAAYAKRIQNMKAGENEIEAVVEALLNAVRALKSLSVVMKRAALFWEQLHDQCKALSEDRIKKMIETALKLPEKRRLEFWNSTGFIEKAVVYYAKWVALNHVCGIYMERIKLTQRELYTYIQEAYRKEDAQKRVKELASRFLVDLQSEQKAIAGRTETLSLEKDKIKEEDKKADEEVAAKKDTK